MSVVMGVVGLLLALGLLILLAYKGHSVIVIAPLVAVVAIVFGSGFQSHIMANYTEVYMVGFASYVKNYFPLYLFGAIFAKLMEVTGNANTIANVIANKLGKKNAVLAVVLACAILTYGGVSLFVVTFAILPIAVKLFRDADIPKRLIPGCIALGAFTFTMTALPGSPQVQNSIPMTYFGTDSFAAPVLGCIAAAIMFTLGMMWLNKRTAQARKAGEGYGEYEDDLTIVDDNNLPGLLVSVIPLLLILFVNLLCSKVIYPGSDAQYISQFATTLSKVMGNWSVLIGLLVSILFMIILNFKKLIHLKEDLKKAAGNSVMPLINSCAVVGFGSVIKGLAVFSIIQTFVLGISSNPLISEFIAVNLLCGITASASGGLGTTLEALAPTYLSMGAQMGISPAVLHRIASVSAGGLDSLPHNGATVTTLSLCGMTHKEAYKDMFVCSVLIPIFAGFVIVILASLGLSC
ncbi:GntP family permease [uncultured Sphaerochaeta sp.]|uniref:GntP family permease n=1 Tax=uncultured Sphaerochaeta sp. TaxID=886478 RepID=UPI002A0A6105|nr:GntP family permease [uncultured Sphaerochaeta sp.]